MSPHRRKFAVCAVLVAAALPLLRVCLAADAPRRNGPDVVVLKELEKLYDAVPFDHKAHAEMAQMWDGCVTCHHRTPQAEAPAPGEHPRKDQDDAARIPACKSCHPATAEDSDIHMPNLKGAYHRQCLNCHREWTHANACSACHQPKDSQIAASHPVTPDDIVGRMHPPIPEPELKIYRARFTPADGGNVLFRHKEHLTKYGLKCVSCHHRDNCANCHDATSEERIEKIVRPGRTWRDSHGPCMSCHKQDRCRHCHYKDEEPPPTPFDHQITGQILDKDHVTLACGKCHVQYKKKNEMTCGGSECHKAVRIAYPGDRPGPMATTRPSIQASSLPGPVKGVAR